MSAFPAPSETSAFNTKAPQVSPAEIERIIHDGYGINTSATLFTSERDVTAHVTGKDGREYIFKIANVSEDPVVIEFQNQALFHIESVNPSLPVPKVVTSSAGSMEIYVDLSKERHVARLLSYLHGIPVYKTASTRAQRQQLGAMLARLTLALKDFTHPASSHKILWDLKHTARLQPLTCHIAGDAKRAIVERVIEHFCETIKPREDLFRHQVVHNDFNPHNVLLNPSNHDEVSGVLDFGDIVAAPIIYDVAVACSYLMPPSGPPLAYAADFLSAYHKIFPLLSEEIDILFDLINTRNAMTVTITEWRAQRYPENSEYILRNNPRASLAIERLSLVSRNEARTTFQKACEI
ncbi:phosphotransferase [Phyllobacterium sp. SB3]|uniref:phosphotransferase n=1 Tax=Phyllobacterium sp. SB3 TaxID=3156073 RepID=UPI0032AF57A6